MSGLTDAEREELARALGCEFHDRDYGECAACGSHAEQVWDEGLEAIVDRRINAALLRHDDEEFCPDCFAGMESDQHRETCILGRGPWPGRLHRAKSLRDSAEELRQTANIIEADGYPDVAQKTRDRAYARLREAEALEAKP